MFAALVGVAAASISSAYQRGTARADYDQHYSQLLELPRSISSPRVSFRRMPGVVGKALWIDFYQPNADEDDELRAWFVKHGGFTEFKPLNRLLPKPIGAWEAGKGAQFLSMSRIDENGWVHLCLGQRMPPDEAKKDLATFPWNSEIRATKGYRVWSESQLTRAA